VKVKIFGAGSIGNHLANASRRLDWQVDVVDIDLAALKRMREEIYPTRYGAWDENIGQHVAGDAPVGGYDLIMIGTPPDHHVGLAREAIAENPTALLIEKPLSTPDLEGLAELHAEAEAAGVVAFTGYDHVVGETSSLMTDALAASAFGTLETLDVEFREHWGGIFAAHPWLAGPTDTYLGFWQRGGGASGEHSHAANLWQHFAHAAGQGGVVEVQAKLDYVREGGADYDRLCLLNLTTQTGFCGRVVQDVVTKPPRKWARAQGSDSGAEWRCGFEPGKDAYAPDSGEATVVTKTRPDDFIRELRHIEDALASKTGASSPISLERGLDTMLVVAAAHRSQAQGRAVRIDRSAGYSVAALD
jgi:predicted dehydrogenase